MLRTIMTALVLIGIAHPAYAWWNPDWAYRKKITLNTSDAGAAIKETLNQVPIAVRLHAGNIPFADIKEEGADLRFVSGDDKTPLKHHVESFDLANELA